MQLWCEEFQYYQNVRARRAHARLRCMQGDVCITRFILNIANLATSVPASFEYHIGRARAHVLNGIARYRHREAAAFYNELSSGGYDPNDLIDALVPQKLIYVSVPKCASTSIKMILSMLVGRHVASLDRFHKRKYSALHSPFQIGVSA